ncbi:PREDICTED: uncharacterized protein LOC104826698 [Tarenaya hassleriana]|uniref:uncharacterized protein LOC104826698 n=1 Tax=Tarenaya hassleriana TaxID=28532 RepID=UPI00053C89B5|nr:PREDICTED: uncharacterized protein LOC104826698 [Tarenaya hassleriana]
MSAAVHKVTRDLRAVASSGVHFSSSNFISVDLEVVSAEGPKGTELQLPAVLDELIPYDGPLGAHYTEEAISLHLGAPTAQVLYCWLKLFGIYELLVRDFR